jgi:hypothetical protein
MPLISLRLLRMAFFTRIFIASAECGSNYYFSFYYGLKLSLLILLIKLVKGDIASLIIG